MAKLTLLLFISATKAVQQSILIPEGTSEHCGKFIHKSRNAEKTGPEVIKLFFRLNK